MSRPGESGSTLIEALITIPFLLFLTSATLDMGGLLVQYLMLNQLSSTAVRIAAKVSGLEGAANQNFVDLRTVAGAVGTCPSGGNADLYCPGHYRVHERIARLIDGYPVQVSNLSISSNFTPRDPTKADPQQVQNSVSVTLRGTYRAFTPLFDGITFEASSRSVYLPL